MSNNTFGKSCNLIWQVCKNSSASILFHFNSSSSKSNTNAGSKKRQPEKRTQHTIIVIDDVSFNIVLEHYRILNFLRILNFKSFAFTVFGLNFLNLEDVIITHCDQWVTVTMNRMVLYKFRETMWKGWGVGLSKIMP